MYIFACTKKATVVTKEKEAQCSKVIAGLTTYVRASSEQATETTPATLVENIMSLEARGSGTGPALTGVIDQGRGFKVGC